MDKIKDMILGLIGPMKMASQSGGMEACMDMLKKKRDEWKDTPLNVAVIGSCGVGKSTFINSIRGLTADDERAAKVGVTETTMVVVGYPHPSNPNLMFSDLPGVGTPGFQRSTYLSDINVDKYDFFLLITAKRFTETDAWLAKEIEQRQKKYFFIRTKVDEDVCNNKKAHPRTHNEQTVIGTIRDSTADHLRSIGFRDGSKIFMIDSYEQEKYDFHKLELKLIDDFPELKRSALVLSMKATSEEMIRLKVKELRFRVWINACMSAAFGAVPVPGASLVFDIGLAVKNCMIYYNQLGLDDASLRRRAHITSTDYHELRSVVRRSIGTEATDFKEVIMAILRVSAGAAATGATVAVAAVAEEGSKFIPMIGSIIGVPVSFVGTFVTLTIVLNKLESTALEVVRFGA